MPVWWLPSGVALAALLNGITHILLKSISRTGIKYTPEYGLIVAGLLACIVFCILFITVKRINSMAVIKSGDRE
jgi:hypothetical protein